MAPMGVRVMSFPFRLERAGAVATVEQGSDPWIEECIAVAMLTRPGERDQVPTFGVDDPAFEIFRVGTLQRHLNDFGPPVTITEVSTDRTQEGREQVVITWQRADSPQQGVLET